MSKRISKKAFTLVETLIMVAVVGIIAVITVVSLKNMSPDKDAVLVRKAYTEMSKAVATLVNDEQLYPSAKVAYNFKDYGLNDSFNSFAAGGNNQEEAWDPNELNPTSCVLIVPGSSNSSNTGNTSNITNELPEGKDCPLVDRFGECITEDNGCDAEAQDNCDGHWDAINCVCINNNQGSSGSSNSSNVTPEVGSDPGNVDITTSSASVSSGISGGNLDKLEKLTGNLKSASNVLGDNTVRNGASAYNSNNKFAYNFAKLFDTRSSSCSGNYCKFTTPDGMAWKVTDNFRDGGGNASIDVNIYNNGKDANTYYFQVDAGGKISIDDNKSTAVKARRYLNSRKMTKSK